MPGELRARAERMAPLETLDGLQALLEGLRQKGFVQRLEPLPGARAPQWDQIVAQRATSGRPGQTPIRTPLAEGALPIAPAASPAGPAPSPPGAARGSLEERVAALEAEVARLRELLGARGTPSPR
jgi:uncharacterized protein YceH (UPF0502 family)